jgi:hypothetical protein
MEEQLTHLRKEYNDTRKRIENDPTKENYRELYVCIIHHLKRIDRLVQEKHGSSSIEKRTGDKNKIIPRTSFKTIDRL